MYNLITGRYLFFGGDRVSKLQNNRDCNLSHLNDILDDLQVSEDFQDLLFNMLNPDHKLRFDSLQALKHPWFEKYSEKIEECLKMNE